MLLLTQKLGLNKHSWRKKHLAETDLTQFIDQSSIVVATASQLYRLVQMAASFTAGLKL